MKKFCSKVAMLGLCMMVLLPSSGNLQASTVQGKQTRITTEEELIAILKKRGSIISEKVANRCYYRYDEKINTQDIAAAENESTSAPSESYSTTNVQVEGVDEADVFKNDGRYLYMLTKSDQLSIVDTTGIVRTVGVIKAGENEHIKEIFLDKDKLILISTRRENKEQILKGKTSKGEEYDLKRYNINFFTSVKVYDITDRTAPKLQRSVEVEGRENTVRKIGNRLYLVTNKYISLVPDDQIVLDELVPCYKDNSISEQVIPLAVDHIWYQDWSVGNCWGDDQYTVLTTLKLEGADPIQVQAIIGEVDNIYMNQESLFLTNYIGGYNSGTLTYITKYSSTDKGLEYKAVGTVDGYIMDQFCMDEYQGNLRIVSYMSSNGVQKQMLSILNSKLDKIGGIASIAEGERLYSVRFDGKKGYIVTFRNVDPLFALDLSNPKEPKILGELKVPGYSTYLHPVGNGLVVGIGRDTYEESISGYKGEPIITRVVQGGIKISLFDANNMVEPKEINHIILGNKYSYSSALANHKAVTTYKDKELLAIPISLTYDAPELKQFNGAYVCGVENGILVPKAKLGKKLSNLESHGSYYYNDDDRVCFIGDKLYFIYSNHVNQYDTNRFSCLQSVEIE